MSHGRPVHTIAYLKDTPYIGTTVDFRVWMTVPHAAKLLDVRPSSVYRMIHTEKLLAIQTPVGLLVHVRSVVDERRRRQLPDGEMVGGKTTIGDASLHESLIGD